MNEQAWWYLSRSAGLVAWLALAATCLWGVLLVTRMLKPADRPAWLLDLHRWLGWISVVTTAVHLGALVADSYVTFGWRELLVPNASEWKTGAVTWGVLALYGLVLIQLSSVLKRHIPRRVWHGIHVLAYPMFAMATIHGVQAGTDRSNLVFIVVGSGVSAVLAFASAARFLQARAKRQRTAAPA